MIIAGTSKEASEFPTTVDIFRIIFILWVIKAFDVVRFFRSILKLAVVRWRPRCIARTIREGSGCCR